MQRTCKTIFRPWDGIVTEEQDSTVSTTQEDVDKKDVIIIDDCKSKAETKMKISDKESINLKGEKWNQNLQLDSDEITKFKLNKLKPSNAVWNCTKLAQDLHQHSNDSRVVLPPSLPSSSDWYGEALLLEAAAMAHGLGHGHVADEYARVLLGEEQRARLHAAVRKQRPKKHKCPHCDVGFSNNGQLKGHIRIHTGERPFRCDAASCGKTFTRNEELTRHKRIHSGLRPFACPECGKRFGRKDHLKKHTRTHVQHRAAAAVAAAYAAVAMPVMSVPQGSLLGSTVFDPWTGVYVPTPAVYGY